MFTYFKKIGLNYELIPLFYKMEYLFDWILNMVLFEEHYSLIFFGYLFTK